MNVLSVSKNPNGGLFLFIVLVAQAFFGHFEKNSRRIRKKTQAFKKKLKNFPIENQFFY